MRGSLRDILEAVYRYFFVESEKKPDTLSEAGQPIPHPSVIDPSLLTDTATKTFQAKPKAD
ncbi:MAG: hypothetical protein PHU51_06100, partial [Candidatus Nanoarchaeia archaeon]|nr:hypothetical protein [Candidatus Nanoarchaeia archaeon]